MDHAVAVREARFFPPITGVPKRRLTPEQVEHYDRRGYVPRITVFREPQVTANRAAFDLMLARVHGRGQTSHSLNGYHATCASIWDLASNPIILDCVEDLLGPSFVCWGSHYFCKLPGSAKVIAWHQDAPYWQFTPTRTVTAWLAIDDADEGNAAMRVIPGSHRAGALPMRPSAADEDNQLLMTTDNAQAYGEPVTLDLRAGEISLHSDLLLHGSLANRSDRRRCGLTLRYATTDVRAADGRPRVCVPGRGSGCPPWWLPIARPAGDDLDLPLSDLVAT